MSTPPRPVDRTRAAYRPAAGSPPHELRRPAAERVIRAGFLEQTVAVNRQARDRVRRRGDRERRVCAVDDSRRRVAIDERRGQSSRTDPDDPSTRTQSLAAPDTESNRPVLFTMATRPAAKLEPFEGRAPRSAIRPTTSVRVIGPVVARIGRSYRRGGRPHIAHAQRLAARRNRPALLKLNAPIAVVSDRSKRPPEGPWCWGQAGREGCRPPL